MAESDNFDKDAINEATENKCCPRCGMDLKELLTELESTIKEKLSEEWANSMKQEVVDSVREELEDVRDMLSDLLKKED